MLRIPEFCWGFANNALMIFYILQYGYGILYTYFAIFFGLNMLYMDVVFCYPPRSFPLISSRPLPAWIMLNYATIWSNERITSSDGMEKSTLMPNALRIKSSIKFKRQIDLPSCKWLCIKSIGNTWLTRSCTTKASCLFRAKHLCGLIHGDWAQARFQQYISFIAVEGLACKRDCIGQADLGLRYHELPN